MDDPPRSGAAVTGAGDRRRCVQPGCGMWRGLDDADRCYLHRPSGPDRSRGVTTAPFPEPEELREYEGALRVAVAALEHRVATLRRRFEPSAADLAEAARDQLAELVQRIERGGRAVD